jgi:hypothetical protein
MKSPPPIKDRSKSYTKGHRRDLSENHHEEKYLVDR